MYKFATMIAAALLAAACSSTPPATPPAPAPIAAAPRVTAPAAQASPAPVAPRADPDAADVARLRNPADILGKRSVYFPLDSYVIDGQFLPLLQAHGQVLSRHPRFKVLVQGNADERGSQEYNLALAQRRAEVIKKTLLSNGATETQVEAVSLGKAKPHALGHDEAAWAENRRGDLVYPGDK